MSEVDFKAGSGPFVVDPRYEFDAPQFWDLSKVSQGSEGPESYVDSWFDSGARANHSPQKTAPPEDSSICQHSDSKAACGDKMPGGRRASFGPCDAMDIDSPEPAVMASAAADPPETHRPMTRSQTKLKGTASRVLKPVNRNTQADAAGKKAASMKRVLEPIVQLPVRSTKPLTEPMEFELQTSKRHRTHAMQTRAFTPRKEGGEFVSLVEKTRLFYEGPNDRFAADNLGKPQTDSKPPPLLTNPKTPYLRSKKRAASRPAAAAVSNAETASNAAATLWEKSLASRSAASSQVKQPTRTSAQLGPTKVIPFTFRTDARAGPAPAKQPVPNPKKGSSKPAGSPKFRTTERAQQRAAQGAFVFKADQGSAVAAPGARSVSHGVKRQTTTKPKPFQLHTQKRHVPKPSNDGHAYNFRARPVPITNNVQNIPPKPQGARNLTVPESPGLICTRRHAAYQEKQQKKLEEEDRKRKEAASFKARGMPLVQPFMPQPSHQPLTVPHQPDFALEKRSEARSQFQHAITSREKAAEEERLAAEEKMKQHEAEEIKQLRKTMVPKARGMPNFAHPFCPTASDIPLTEAHSPKLGRHNHP